MKKKPVKLSKNTYEVMGSYGGKTGKPNYSNETDLFSIKHTFETDGVLTSGVILDMHLNFRDICKQAHLDCEEAIIAPNTKKVIETNPSKIMPAVEFNVPDAELNRKADFLAAMSQCTESEELAALGATLAKRKQDYGQESLKELREAFNTKMKELKNQLTGGN